MNLRNATLVSRALPTASAAGKVVYGAAEALGVRCILSGLERRHATLPSAVTADVVGVLYLFKADVPAGFDPPPEPGQKVIATVDGGDAEAYRISHVRDWQKDGGLAHWECFLRELKA